MSHCDFDLYSLIAVILSIFSCVYCHFCILLGITSIQKFASFSAWVIFFVISVLHIFTVIRGYNSFSGIWFANIFFSVGYFVLSQWCSLKGKHWWNPVLTLFLLFLVFLVSYLGNLCQIQNDKDLLMFSSKSSIVVAVTVKS